MRAAVLAALLALADPARSDVAVPVGGDAQADGCGARAEVDGIGAAGGLTVRAGPGMRYRARDLVRRGRTVALCAERGAWLGIVYGAPGFDCGVATARRAAYDGPCRSGWVHRRYLKLTAG